MRGTGPTYPNMGKNIQDMKNFGKSVVGGVAKGVGAVGKGVSNFIKGKASYQVQPKPGYTYYRGQQVPMPRMRQKEILKGMMKRP